jgi:hypothetical protein
MWLAGFIHVNCILVYTGFISFVCSRVSVEKITLADLFLTFT